jgi:phage shock protein A
LACVGVQRDKGLLNRIWQVIRANVTHLVGQAEDPEKVLEQAVLDMQEDLIQLRQAVAQAIATQKRTERQFAQAQSQAEEWYKRAQLALEKEQESLAREALSRRQTYLDTAKMMQSQLTQQTGVVDQLKKNLLVLESKLTEAKTKKDMYIARARSAKASQNLQELMGRMGSGGAASAFERMEEKVLQLEAQASAATDLTADSLDRQFAALESTGNLEDELAALKAKLAGSSTPELPPQDFPHR